VVTLLSSEIQALVIKDFIPAPHKRATQLYVKAHDKVILRKHLAVEHDGLSWYHAQKIPPQFGGKIGLVCVCGCVWV
jgi:hypothetical protein